MINSISRQSQWVFSAKEDLLLFAGSTILAFIGSFFIDSFENYFWMFVFFDQPHVFTTYFYTYTSDRFSSQFRTTLILLPIICFICSYALWTGFSDAFVYAVLGNFSVFHFAKQQCAWFFIAGAKEGRSLVWSNYEKLIDRFVAYSAIGAPMLLSMTDAIGRSGWRRPGDLILVPMWLVEPIIVIWVGSWIAYLALQIKKYRHDKTITWGKHFHLLNGQLIWFIYRIIPIEQVNIAGQMLIVFGHSFPYIYLGLNYYESRKTKEKFWPGIQSIKLMACFVIAATILISYIEVVSERKFYSNGIVPCIWMGLIFTHFLIDTFMWKYDTHPEGLEFLKKAG